MCGRLLRILTVLLLWGGTLFAQDNTYWLGKAAEQGFPDAQYKIGLIFASGQSVPRDFRKAAIWFAKAAEQGKVEAQCALARLYMWGCGVPQDSVEAYKWFSVAVASIAEDNENAPKARQYRYLLMMQMSPDQIVEGQRRADEFLSTATADEP